MILTGALDDGTAGLLAIKRRCGVAIVQDPEEALYPGMPSSALENVKVDYCLSLKDMTSLLIQLSNKTSTDDAEYPVPEEMEKEVRIAAMETHVLNYHEQIGKPSPFSCPECGRTLFRCYATHRSPEDGTTRVEHQDLRHRSG